MIEIRDNDPIYSPEGNLVQRKRGLFGEERMRKWLDERGIKYKREEELRAEGGKTPDFLLERPIFLRGEEINWIESKVVSKKNAEKMTPEELEGKIITGEMYHNTERPEYTDEYAQLIERVQSKKAG